MRSHKEIILEAMNSMLGSAQFEARPGITLKKFLREFELLREYPKESELGRFTKGQIRYIKQVLDSNYEVKEIDGEKYYISRSSMI